MTAQIHKTIELKILQEVDVAYAALDAKNRAKDLGFSTSNQYLISTAVSELARNIFVYAKRGSIFLNSVEDDARKGIEIIALDSGPGIKDLKSAMKDKYSTGGTLGVGLPGTKRLMDDFDICSTSNKGTKVTVRKWI